MHPKKKHQKKTKRKQSVERVSSRHLGALRLVASRANRKPLAAANEQNEPTSNPIGSLECDG